MSKISRRAFLVSTGTAAGALGLARPLALAAERASKLTRGTDRVTLGNTGIRTTVLGIGTGTRGGSEQRALGPDGFARLARYAYERGIRYIDTADMYRMHATVRAAIKGLPREELFIQTKTRAKDAASAKADIERFRMELGLDQLDTLLMHAMGSGRFPTDMRPVMDVLDDAKQKGRVRAVGVSCHGFAPLAASVDPGWIDVHLVRINPFESHMDGPPEKVSAEMKKMHQKGRGIIGMKIFGEDGYDSRQKRRESLKYVLGLGCVHAFTIGFTSTQQIDETLKLIEEASA